MTTNELTELDRMLAFHAMKWWLKGVCWYAEPEGAKWTGYSTQYLHTFDHSISFWHPTRDIAQAMMVAEKIGEGFMLVKDRSGQGYFCTYSSQGLMGCGVVETPALAICLAAKGWLEAREK